MFKNDVSYLYTDEYFTSSLSSNTAELSSKTLKTFEYQPIHIHACRRPSSVNRRSKHILGFGDEILKRDKRHDKHRMTIRRLNDKQQSFEDNLCKQIQQLENDQSQLESQLAQLQLYKTDLENVIHHSLSTNSVDEVSLMDENEVSFVFDSYGDDSNVPNMLITEGCTFDDSIETDFDDQ